MQQEPKIHPLLRSSSRKQLYKYLKEGWSEEGKREILAEIARRKKKHGIRSTGEEAVTTS